jgi:hypothetical protein
VLPQLPSICTLLLVGFSVFRARAFRGAGRAGLKRYKAGQA